MVIFESLLAVVLLTLSVFGSVGGFRGYQRLELVLLTFTCVGWIVLMFLTV
jgi:hypothetical protein